MLKIKFSENLRTLRASRKISQKELAKLLGVDQRTVSAWENKICEPAFEVLEKLCEIFDEDFNGILS